MITMQALSQVVIQYIITKIFGKPCKGIITTFKNSEIEVVTKWSGDDLKIVIKKIKGRVSGDRRIEPKKQIWTPGRGGESGLVKPKIVSNPIIKQ